ncbi:hypothetical protein BECAL_01797 [Bellilinea caldifistulae]|uniref:hypothetical protein n=1 Tax=Bellilinea caldifistulae TaxID=360411 RepID=UPI00078570F2|nr:hypothetical protein [Bellilinea caldifistulae]GAP10624.1 hypothetical protein BECAL_01797 [Bellilinea caldifistulae]
MKINDQQFGRPQILYKATKVQIEATPNPQAGMIAFATDTNQIGIYTSGGWQWGSGGDMLKAVYDVDNDGIVDAAESVDWNGVQNKPSTYPPSSHQHAASDVTSGVFDPARIPNLDASKITSGTLSTDRFSAYNDLVAESRIGLGTDRVVDGVYLRSALNKSSNIVEDFTSSSAPSGWQWAGSPFVTPPGVTFGYSGTLLRAYNISGSFRAFFYKTPVPSLYSYSALCGFDVGSGSADIGIRLDDGTDNNYAEVVWRNIYSTTDPNIRVHIRMRTGGGTVVETEVTNMRLAYIPAFDRLTLIAFGTRWSSWDPRAAIDNINIRLSGSQVPGSNVSWTPQRVGIVISCANAQTWHNYTVDAVAF